MHQIPLPLLFPEKKEARAGVDPRGLDGLCEQAMKPELRQIKTYLHVWNAEQRAHRLKHQAATRSSGMSDNSGQTSRQEDSKC